MSVSATKTVRFFKYSAAGNDFILVDARWHPNGDLSAEARGLCRRRRSVGADGLIRIDQPRAGDPDGIDARMQLWNADGSTAAFSGNAARCAMRYLADEGIAHGEIRLGTDIGIVEGTVDKNRVRARLPGIAEVTPNVRLRVEGRELVGTSVQVGVPFFVLLHDDPDQLPVRFLGQAIRRHELLAPAGANVAFVRVDNEQSLYFRVFERGVEDETLSSGTGSISATLAAAAANLVETPVLCKAKGGRLEVRFQRYPPVGTSDVGGSAARTRSPDAGVNDTESYGSSSESAARKEAAVVDQLAESTTDAEPLRFGEIELESETRRVMCGDAFLEALSTSR